MASVSKCPICGKVSVEAFKPFCSERCAMVDLGRWIGEGYKVPTEEERGGIPGEESE